MKLRQDYGYIQRSYNVPAKKGQLVKYKDRLGLIAGADGQYIYIWLNGDQKPTGPYHPTSEITYFN